eukprot:TRINITY_DN29931_c0_g1_i1.p1 TRINITY_DN29931_c0_g1~~TRINITY_DN29931_c0_g1_i1.p1  ORF type:complete len:1315 (+),score=272.70 TRINITY_DN29931_c0_g1_i1:68-4012(+)
MAAVMRDMSEWYLRWLDQVLVDSSSFDSAAHQRRERSRSRDLKKEKVLQATRKLHNAIQASRLTEALEAVEEFGELKASPPQDMLRSLLDHAAKKPGAADFAKALKICSVGGLVIDPVSYARLLGHLMSRDASYAQVRAVLNMGLSKAAKTIPLVPEDMSVEETLAAFEDGRIVLPQEDGEAGEGNEGKDAVNDGPSPEEPLPEVLVCQNCESAIELNGEYNVSAPMPEMLDHDRPIYVKVGSPSARGDDDPSDKEDDEEAHNEFYVYFWQDDDSKPWKTGWYVGTEVGGDTVLAYHPSDSKLPPRSGWQAILDGARFPDKASFVLPREAQTTNTKVVSPEEMEAALAEVDLESLRGMVQGKKSSVAAYFGHFMALLHLEKLAEVGTFRKRMLRHPAERLVRMGFALDGLLVQGTFGRREHRKGCLPGWSDRGCEFVSFTMPRMVDFERLRLKRGESVVISRSDPMKDRIGEGSVVDMDKWKLVVNVSCKMPEDAKQVTWRVDSYANRIVYERQFGALLQLASAEKLSPLCELLVAGDVGKLDAWARREAERVSQAPGKRTRTAAQLKREEAKNEAATDKLDSRAAGIADELITLDKERLSSAKDEIIICDDLNESQKSAVESAIRRRCTVIQGPPGTGKTHVSVKTLLLWTKTMKIAPILATSDSNVAVDNIAEGLQKAGVKAVRVGRPEKVRDFLEDICIDTLVAKERAEKKEAKRIKKEAKLAAQRQQEEKLRDMEEAVQKRKEKKEKLEATRQYLLDAGLEGEDTALELGLVDDLGDDDVMSEDGVDDKSEAVEGSTHDPHIEPVNVATVKGKHGSNVKTEDSSSDDESDMGMKQLTAQEEMRIQHARRQKQRKADHLSRMRILKDAEVICTTTISAGGDMMKEFNFGAILVDEVAQATELSTVVPIILRGARQLVLVGDQCQLPPSVMSREAELRGLSLSIYSRLVESGLSPMFLDTQYRSHPKIAEFSCKTFYQDALKSGIDASVRPMPVGMDWPNPEVPVAFIEVGEREAIDGESKSNPVEVQRVLELVTQVLKFGELSPEDIGVVSPYMAQVRALRKTLRSQLPGDFDKRLLEISSIDNFQGREKQLIIFSAVRSNPRGNVGFLADWRRLNVMLTRAKRGLVVFGTAKTLRHDCHWQQWLEWCEEHDAIDWSRAAPESFKGSKGKRKKKRGFRDDKPDRKRQRDTSTPWASSTQARDQSRSTLASRPLHYEVTDTASPRWRTRSRDEDDQREREDFSSRREREDFSKRDLDGASRWSRQRQGKGSGFGSYRQEQSSDTWDTRESRNPWQQRSGPGVYRRTREAPFV